MQKLLFCLVLPAMILAIQTKNLQLLFSQAQLQFAAAGEEAIAYEYFQQEVKIPVDDAVTLAGTLTLPNSTGRYPVAILISGSSPDDRDAEHAGFRPFRILAEHLASRGIGSLRYDDRGIGESSGKNTLQYTVNELAIDIDAAIAWLHEYPNVNSKYIGLIGHSFGGMLGPLVASRRDDVAFVVSMAGPASDPAELNPLYRQRIYQLQGRSPEDVDRRMQIEWKMYDLLTKAELSKLERDMRVVAREDFEAMGPVERQQFINFDQYFAQTWFGICLPFIDTPFFMSWAMMQPQLYLSGLKVPSLFLFGERDEQVRAEDSAPVITRSLAIAGNFDYTIDVVPNACHYFTDKWGTFAPGVLDRISGWILARVIHPSSYLQQHPDPLFLQLYRSSCSGKLMDQLTTE
jgi:uncharacterized protein